MAKPLSINVKANIIGIGALLIVGAYLAYDLTRTENTKPCSDSYPPSIALNMDLGNGEVLSSAALQARSGAQDWGVMENVSIESVSDAPVAHVLKVALPNGDISSKYNKKGGVGFPWRPSQLDGASSVCFAFNIWVPKDFDFTAGGILPGVASDVVEAKSDDGGATEEDAWTRKLRAHLSWSSSGTLQAIVFDPSGREPDSQVLVGTDGELQPGQWHQVQTEVILNDEGKSNGSVKLWLDSLLIGAQENLSLRTANNVKFETVLYHISRGTPLGNGSRAKIDDTALRLSPVAVSWRE